MKLRTALLTSRAAHVAALGVAGALFGWLGWFFGPNGWFAAPLVLALVLAGVWSERSGRRPSVTLGAYGAIAGSQAIVFVLVVTHVIPDASLTPVIVGARSMTSHVLGHVFVQGIYLASFVSARSLGRRYRALAAQLEEASRAEAVRAALLEEARAEYRRALQLGQRASARRIAVERDPESTDVDLTSPIATEPWTTSVSDPAELPATASASDDRPAGAPAWVDANRYRMRRVAAFTLLLCTMGAALLGMIAVRPLPLYVAWACIAGIAVAIWVHNRVWALGPASWWAWTAAAFLSVGPAYSIGLHSGFAGIVAALLFLGGLFRAPDRAARTDRRHRVYVGTAIAHGAAFLLIERGVLPDFGNVPVLVEGAPQWQAVAQHLLLQAVYGASYAAGVRVDRRYAALMAEADASIRRAAQADAKLAAANAEIDRVLGADAEAIFRGTRVGRFRLEQLLGRGGMGDVYDAVDPASGTRAAVKLIRRDRARDPRALALFAAEARALARVQSEYVARVLEVGGVGAELPYIAMELVEGRTLASLLKERGRLSLAEIRILVRHAAAGLADVHSAAVLHRDIKPQNIAQAGIGETARWKLLDFGVARIHDIVGASRSGIAGTPRYMAPEQALGEPIDARADLYSLCLVIYRALTGRPAYLESDRLEIARAARSRPAPDPRWYVPVPRDVERVLRIGLAASPEDRFNSAAELGAAFELACEGTLSRHHRARAEALLAREPWSEPARVPLPPDAPEPSTRVSP